MTLPLPISEVDRLAALDRTKVLEMPHFVSADLYVNIAAEIMRTPMSAITVIDKEVQWFKASKSLNGIKQTSRAVSFCAHAIKEPSCALYIPDARQDPRFAKNAAVTGKPGVRFYLGVPLLTAEGYPMGALCVIDVVPRKVSEDQILKLRGLAKMVEKSMLLGGATHIMNSRAKTFALIAAGICVDEDLQRQKQRQAFDTVSVPKTFAPTKTKAFQEAFASIESRLSGPDWAELVRV